MEKNNPPEWAIKEACKRACVQYEGYLGWGYGHSKKLMIECAARYIAEHEEEPVDPLLLEAREICAEHAASGDSFVQPVLAALKRGIELGKEQS